MTDTGTRIKTSSTRLIELIEDVGKGVIKIPIFQRDFVWNHTQMIELFDSIVKGFPIGSILLWDPDTEYKTKNKIGPHLIDTSSSKRIYVLDGYQRISTLFGTLYRPDDKENQNYKEFDIYYDLENKEFVKLRIRNPQAVYLPLYKVLDPLKLIEHYQEIMEQYPDKQIAGRLIENGKILNKVFSVYQISLVTIEGGDIRSSVEIFSRINSKGVDISEDYMLQALSYNQENDFLLGDKISEFINSLEPYGWGDMKRDVILNCISSSLGELYFETKVEELAKEDLKKISADTFVQVRKAVSFLYERCKVLTYSLLPYPIQLIFISDFFKLKPNPTEEHLDSLTKWFWQTSYSNYFTILSPSSRREAFSRFHKLAIDGDLNSFWENSEELVTAKFPDKMYNNSVRGKTLQLFILNRLFGKTVPSLYAQYIRMYVFNDRDKTVGNVILVPYSEKRCGNVADLFNELEEKERNDYFLHADLIALFNNKNEDEFLEKRKALIISEERKFVGTLKVIKYQE